MPNTSPCSACQHYDPILRGMKETGRGWCSKKSLYPYADSPGQTTPPNAKRVTEPTALAKPVIVARDGVVGHCTDFTVIRAKPTKAALEAQALRGGR